MGPETKLTIFKFSKDIESGENQIFDGDLSHNIPGEDAELWK